MKYLSYILVLVLCISFITLPASAAEKGFIPDTNTNITADAIYLVNMENNEVLYEKDADTIIYPASITKVLAAVIAIEETDNLDTEIITYPMNIQNEVYEYINSVGSISLGNLVAGEEMSMKDYLYAMLLPSANEASMAVAQHVGGTQEAFCDMMNNRAKELGCENTNFTNATGLFDEKHVSTAKDLFIITQHALSLPEFADIVQHYTYTVNTNIHDSLTWESTIKMQDPSNTELYYEPIKGVKTGTVPESGYSFVSTASKDGFEYMLVLIGADITLSEDGKMIREENRAFTETKAIYNWAFENLRTKTLIEQGKVLGEIPVNLSREQDFVQIEAKEHFSSIIPDNLDIEGDSSVIQKQIVAPDFLDAPIEKGIVVGEVIVFAFGEEIGRIPLVTSSKVEASTLLKIWKTVSNLGKSFWFKFVLIFLALIIVFYIILLVLRNRNRKRKNRIYRK